MPANYVLLEKVTLSASAASVVLDNIPQSGYTDLKLVCSARGSNAGEYNTYIQLAFNGVSTNLSERWIYGNGASVLSLTETRILASMPAANATASTFGNTEFYIPNYTSANYKSVEIDSVGENNATSAIATLGAGLWSNTAAITSINLSVDSASFVAGSTFYLYGLAAVGTTPEIAPLASGGNIVTNDGTYWYHAFTSSGNFTPAKTLSCDVLVVAGGGGGGAAGAGGGAGGYLTFTSQTLTENSYSAVAVGAGGAGQTQSATGVTGFGATGSDSQFGALTLVKGGGGAAGGQGGNGNIQGLTGGSGGGSVGTGPLFGNTSNFTSGQGSGGGQGIYTGGQSSNGGGGGAGAQGENGASNGATGRGGNGLFNDISGGATTGLGQLSGGNYYFAGGGGSSVFDTTIPTPLAGGLGGGGTGGRKDINSGQGYAGTASTGGGGGGGCVDGPGGYVGRAGGAGGSGVVIIRYPIA